MEDVPSLADFERAAAAYWRCVDDGDADAASASTAQLERIGSTPLDAGASTHVAAARHGPPARRHGDFQGGGAPPERVLRSMYRRGFANFTFPVL